MMNKYLSYFLMLGLTALPMLAPAVEKASVPVAPYTATSTTQSNITPDEELKRLMEGNKRFTSNTSIRRNLLQQAKGTATQGQFPAAVILSCMDSRGSPELIFDQGLGDVFSVRVAGNVVDNDQLGGMEFATKVVGSKLVVVMGHTSCGAVKGACEDVHLGNLTALLQKIQPAVAKFKSNASEKLNCNDYAIVDEIAKQNVIDMIKEVASRSAIIQDQVDKKQIKIVGAMHDLKSGKVIFFDKDGQTL